MPLITLKKACTLDGVGLHTGRPARVCLEPAPAGSGLAFLRTDLPHARPIPARSEFVTGTRLATTLSDGGSSVRTIEHLLAACLLTGLSDLLLRVEGEEIPIRDGSARDFLAAIDAVGRQVLTSSSGQPLPRGAWRVQKRLEVAGGRVSLEPCQIPMPRPLDLRLTCTIAFSEPYPLHQTLHTCLAQAREAVGSARTFGFLPEIELLRREGLAQGGSLENALVLGPSGWLNGEHLRFPDEPVRHKLLDALGDLALAAGPVLAHLELLRAGHSSHLELVRALEAGGGTWEPEGAEGPEWDH